MHLLRTPHIKEALAEYPAVSASIIKSWDSDATLLLKVASEEEEEEEEDTNLTSHRSLQKRERKMSTTFSCGLLEGSVFLMETWRSF